VKLIFVLLKSFVIDVVSYMRISCDTKIV